MTAGVPAEIQTGHLKNISQKPYCQSQLAQYIFKAAVVKVSLNLTHSFSANFISSTGRPFLSV
jgi:hypothetical protein